MIKHISITNMAKFEGVVEFELPAIALINGKNQAGKTSLINCIQYIAAQGHDPEIVHGDAEFGEIIVTLNNGDQLRARASRRSGDTIRGWKPAAGKKWTMNRELIDAVCNALAYNPLSFLELSDKQQVEKLLQIMPIPFDPAEIQEAVGEAEPETRDAAVTESMNGLEIVGAIEKSITAARRTIGVQADTQEKHASELESALPPAAPGGTDWGAEAKRLQSEKDRIAAEHRKSTDKATAEYQALVDVAKETYRVEHDKIDAEINRQISLIERERTDRKAKASAVKDKSVEDARNAHMACLKSAVEVARPALEKLTADLSTAQERDRADQQATGTRKAIHVARNEATVKKSRYKILTEALTRLTKLKATIAGRLPIPGIVIQEGKIWRDEAGKLVPFSRWNQSDQDLFCVKLGILAYGERAGVLCLDGFEKFDSQRRTGFLKTCEKYAASKGIQFVIASVSDGPLEVVAPEVKA